MTPSQSTDDLVKRLRNWADDDGPTCYAPFAHHKEVQLKAADTIERLQADLAARDKTIETLREKIREAYEVYAGSEGFIPETAPEGYQQRIIGQITEILAGALAARSEEKP